MNIDIYYCNNFLKNIERSNVRDQIISKLERIKNIEFFSSDLMDSELSKILERYSSEVYILKTKGKENTRTIIHKYKPKNIEEYVYFIREFINHSEYEQKWRNGIEPQIKDGSWIENHPLQSGEIEEAVIQFHEIRKKPELSSPPAKLTEWMIDFNPNILFSVFETDHWVEFSISNSPKENMKIADKGFLWEIINNIVIDKFPDSYTKKIIIDQNRNLNVIEYNEREVCVIYEDLNLTDIVGDNKIKKIVLHSGGNIINQVDHIEKSINIAKDHSYFSKVENFNYDIKQVSRYCNKAYPYSAVKDRDSWFKIQSNDENSNLCLLPEQIQLLNTLKFPSFINGQAGSGKSTMLYYLFTEICVRKIIEDIGGNIIYLTENSELLQNAKRDIIALLKANSQYSGYNFSDDDLSKTEDFFSTFLDLLIDIYEMNKLVDDKNVVLGNMEKFITFAKFKQHYLNSNLSKSIKINLSPELSWYVITTFIKGYDRLGFLTPEAFNTIHRRDKGKISLETYKNVFEEVWTKFYLPWMNNNNSWDRLDLVRYILNNYTKFITNYSVIFCDEAQDFTKVELQLLIKMSEFTNFNLSKEDSVPILFAGDPFQTVNPTGFNLEKIKNLFNNELKEQLNFDIQGKELVKDLKYNYRSSAHLVNLSNMIQFLRFKFLGVYELREPQEAKQPISDKFEYPKLICISDEIKDELKKKLQYDKIIIPCDDGEENEFLQKDKWLSHDENIQSAVRSKGSEYGRVILYNFGQFFVNNFDRNEINNMLNLRYQEEDGKMYKLSFFFNKLYVAITRAKKTLVILDTKEGIDSFWNVIKTDPKILDGLKENTNWNSSIMLENIYKNVDVSSLDEPDKDTALANAFEDSRIGKMTGDKEKMLSAAKFFRKGGDENNSMYCEAKYYEFDNDWKKAGDKFTEIKKYTEACDCYWYGGLWDNLLSLRNIYSDIPVTRIIVSSIMNNEQFSLEDFNQFSDSINDEIKDKKFKQKSEWKVIFFKKLAEYFENSLENIPDNKLLNNIANSLNILSDQSNLFKLIGDYYFKAESYSEAIEAWDRIEYCEHPNYYKSKLHIGLKDVNLKIYYLDKLEKFDQILKEYIDNRDQIRLNEHSMQRIIIKVLIKCSMFSLLLENSILLYNFKEVFKLISNDKEYFIKYLKTLNESFKIDSKVRDEILDKNFEYFFTELFGSAESLNLNNLNQILNFQDSIRSDKNEAGKKLNIMSIYKIPIKNIDQEIDIIIQILKLLAINNSENIFYSKDTQENNKLIKLCRNLAVTYILKEIGNNFNNNVFSIFEICSLLERYMNIYIQIGTIYEHILEFELPEHISHYVQKRWLKAKYKQMLRKSSSDSTDSYSSGRKQQIEEAIIPLFNKVFANINHRLDIKVFDFSNEPDLPNQLEADEVIQNVKKPIKRNLPLNDSENLMKDNLENFIEKNIKRDNAIDIITKRSRTIKMNTQDINLSTNQKLDKKNTDENEKVKTELEYLVDNKTELLNKRVDGLEKKMEQSDEKLNKILDILGKMNSGDK